MVKMELRRFTDIDYQIENALNTLGTNLSFADDTKTVMITSYYPNEGKSFVAMQLLKTMATNMRFKAILVDADLRASVLQQEYGIKVTADTAYQGLSGYLRGRCDIADIIGSTNIPHADIILAGKTTLNTLPLFNSANMVRLVNCLEKKYDIVIIDTPPIGTIVDAAKIATLCDGALFVVASGTVHAHRLREAASQIERAGCPVLGYVLNKAKTKSKEDGYYYGQYGN